MLSADQTQPRSVGNGKLLCLATRWCYHKANPKIYQFRSIPICTCVSFQGEPLNVTTVISQGVPLTYFAFQGLFPICILGVLSFTPNADWLVSQRRLIQFILVQKKSLKFTPWGLMAVWWCGEWRALSAECVFNNSHRRFASESSHHLLLVPDHMQPLHQHFEVAQTTAIFSSKSHVCGHSPGTRPPVVFCCSEPPPASWGEHWLPTLTPSSRALWDFGEVGEELTDTLPGSRVRQWMPADHSPLCLAQCSPM